VVLQATVGMQVWTNQGCDDDDYASVDVRVSTSDLSGVLVLYCTS